MRLRESFALDAIIKERAASLSRDDLQADSVELAKRAKVLAILVDARDQIDNVMMNKAIKPAFDVGGISINLEGGGDGATGGAKTPYQPFDGGDLAASIKRELRKAVSTCR